MSPLRGLNLFLNLFYKYITPACNRQAFGVKAPLSNAVGEGNEG